MTINRAINADLADRLRKEQQEREAIKKALVQNNVQATPDILNAILANTRQIVNQTVISFDVQQFSQRVTDLENRDYGQIFGVLASSVTAGQVLYWNESGQFELASAANIGHVNKIAGLAIRSGLPTDQIPVVISGVVENANWNMQVNQLVYLGLGGEITQEQVGVFSQSVGFVLTPTKVFVRIGRAIVRG